MTGRKENLDGILMALEVLKRMSTTRWVTIKEVQQQLQGQDGRFNRTERNYQKLFQKLVAEGLLEQDSSSKPYRFRSSETSRRLSVRSLNAKEALLLTLAEQQLKPLLPAKLMQCMDGFFKEARVQLAEGGTATREREWLQKVHTISTSQKLLPPKIKEEVFEEVSAALFGNFWLDISYKGLNAESPGRYKVMPLGLIQQGPRIYLACRYDGYSDTRSLALHRMNAAKASTLTFDRPPSFNLSQVTEDVHFDDAEPEMVNLSFAIDKENGQHIVECPLAKDQVVMERKDYFQITATVQKTDTLLRWLRGFGDAISKVKLTYLKGEKN